MIWGWIIAAVSAGVSYSAHKKAKKAQKAAESAAKGVLVNKISNIEDLPVIYGQRRVGGTKVFISTKDVPGGDENEYLYICFVIGEGEVSSISALEFDEIPASDDRFSGLVQYNVHLGTENQSADSLLLEAPGWTSAHKLNGVAYIALKLKYDEDAWSGLPDITAVVQGRKVYDLRDGSTAFSNNPALCLYDYLTNTRYGKGLPSTSLDTSSFTAAANQCDTYEVTPYSGGSDIKIFQCDYVLDTGEKIIDNVKDILLSCRGFLPFTNGKYFLKIDASSTSQKTFNKENIIGSFNISGGKKEDTINRQLVTFPNASINYREDQAYYPDASSSEEAAYLDENYDELLQNTLELNTCSNYYIARDIARILTIRSREQLRVSFTTDSSGLELMIADVITVVHDTPDWGNKLFQIEELTLNADMTVNILAVEYNTAIYAYDTAAVQKTYPDTNLPDIFTVAPPTNLNSTTQANIAEDGTVVSSVEFSWTGPSDSFVNKYEFSYRLATGIQDFGHITDAATTTTNYGLITSAATITDSYGLIDNVAVTGAANYTSVIVHSPNYVLTGTLPGAEYEVRVRSINDAGIRSSYVNLTEEIDRDTTPPSMPQNLTATAGLGTITLSWQIPGEKDYSHCVIYRADSDSFYNSSKIGISNGDTFIDSGLGYNQTKYYWIEAVDYSGNAQTPTSSVNATTLFVDSDAFSSAVNDLFAEAGAYGIQPVSSLPASGDFTGQIKYDTTANALYRWTGSAWSDDIFSVEEATVTAASFASNIDPISIVNSLPSPTGYTGPKVVFLTTDNQLYRYNSTVPEFTNLIPADNISGTLNEDNFSSDLKPIKVVSSLPTDLSGYAVGQHIYDTATNKLYRFSGLTWDASVSTSQLSGNIDASNIASDAITADKLADDAVTSSAIQNDAITSAKIADGAVTSGGIADDAVTSAKLALAAVQEDIIAAGAITETKLSDDAVTGDKLADSAVGSVKLADDAVTNAKIAVDAIQGDIIAAAAIDGNKIAADAVSAVKIAQNAVTEAKVAVAAISSDLIATNAITTAKIADGAIVQATIANDAVTTTKIANNTITAGNIADGNITGSKLLNASVNSDKLGSGAVTSGKLGTAAVGTSALALSAVTANKIADGEVLNSKLSSTAVSSSKIQSGSVTTDKLGAGAVSTAKIKNGAIGTTQIATDAITTSKVADGAIVQASIANDAVTTTKIANGNVTAANIADGNVTAAKIGNYSINSDKLGSNSVTSAKLATNSVTTTKIEAGAITSTRIADGEVLNSKLSDTAVNASKIIGGSITSDTIATGAVTTAKIYSNSVTTTKINAGAVVANKISSSSITADKLQSNSVTTAKIATFAVTANEINTGSVSAAKIAATSVTADKLASNSVTTAKVAAGAITAGEIKASSITSAKIAANTISASNIAAGAVTTSELAAGAVTTGKIAANSITATQIAASQITSNKIAANAVTTTALTANAVTAAKISAGAVTANEIAANAITTAKIAANAITASEIAAGSVTANSIIAGAITATKIATAAVTANTIASDAITASKIDAGAVTAQAITSGAVTAGKIASNAVTTVKLAADSITSAKIATGAVTADSITAGAISSGKIAASAITAGKIASNAITSNKISANAITAGKIAAGAVSATSIAADAITTDKIAANSITAGLIASSGVITDSAQISNGVINAANISNGAITNAKIGNAAITNAKIGNLEVDTIKIANQAVTVTATTFKNTFVKQHTNHAGLSVPSDAILNFGGKKYFGFYRRPDNQPHDGTISYIQFDSVTVSTDGSNPTFLDLYTKFTFGTPHDFGTTARVLSMTYLDTYAFRRHVHFFLLGRLYRKNTFNGAETTTLLKEEMVDKNEIINLTRDGIGSSLDDFTNRGDEVLNSSQGNIRYTFVDTNPPAGINEYFLRIYPLFDKHKSGSSYKTRGIYLYKNLVFRALEIKK